MTPYVAFHLGDSLQEMSILYEAMKVLVDYPVICKWQLLSSADILCKQFGLNQAQQNVEPDLNSNYLILIVCVLTNSADPDEIPLSNFLILMLSLQQ